ncbi:hypothetical protein [Clostridium ganghwense]|uniref:Uncharacterized protein n=1 Tax=Clostridium ganghwense TaxID=312089 RepID=A0ABT4CU73_9CLOT|nr:hypothetical protein [Clostridium ganghwense]MCY6372609.1 hypothetical protein [Clostridium ganghwense]
MSEKDYKDEEISTMHNIHHEIEAINEKHNPISNEDEFAVIGNNTELGDIHELDTNIETNPFPFSQEKRPFYKEDNKR